MSDHRLAQLRQQIADATYHDERVALQTLTQDAALSQSERTAICTNAAQIVTKLRAEDSPGMMEVFLAEYGLSSDEGIALMCLAEALLRVPDAPTIDALIEDKIAPSNWGRHLGQSTSSLVNASTWALMLTGRVLDEGTGLVAPLRAMVKRLGEPVIRKAVGQAMREMGRQFVLGQDITAALKRAAGMEAKGYTYSYDMLGEAACTQEDASAYHLAYSRAISAIAPACRPGPVAQNPGISIKLSALHPRYERAQKDRVMGELVPRLKALALLAKTAGMGLNIDAEEANRLELSLDVIEAALSAPELAGWDGFGVVIQAYGQRAGLVIDWLATLARKHDRKVMVRLVKGAYWDAEIKQAQVDGMAGFPVFTAKHATDISYIANARKLLDASDVIYPQFATHNAHTMAAVEHIAAEMGRAPGSYEFQRLHGKGEALHGIFRDQYKNRCRIYAPVGAHRDLLAYLVRRLLENGANSSFVNQIVDEAVPAEVVAADPFAVALRPSRIATGTALFAPERQNSKGWDLAHEPDLTAIEAGRAPFRQHQWQAGPLIAAALANSAAPVQVHSPATGAHIGFVQEANAQDCAAAFAGARPWAAPATERAAALR
ncbi:MAG: proline dehydrogenase family protein, partial [Rhodobacteraceae bacterium]|nr:proline dehydrogenase family protein [Paracoccaceae bacterium]